ncbi:MAG: hypothetical protein AABW79_03385 [Nanoarchaeota archaeon]
MKTTKTKITRVGKALATVLALAPLRAYAEEPIIAPAKLTFQSRNAYVHSAEQDTLNTQHSLIYTHPDFTSKTLLETLPEGKINIGTDFSTNDFRLNLGHGFRENEDMSRASFTFYPQHDSAKSFIGATYQSLPQGNRAIFIGGFDLTDKLHLEATFDTQGNVRGAIFPSLGTGNGVLGIGGGISSEGKFDINASYNTDKIWASIKLGDRPIDARFVFGDVDPNFTRYITTVTGQGDNELDVFPDQTLKFDIANGFFDYFGPHAFFLGKDQGDIALDIRFKESSKLYGNFSYRLGDIGPLKETAITGGLYRDLSNEKSGVTLETGFKLFDKKSPLEIRLKADINEEGKTMIGLFGEIKF